MLVAFFGLFLFKKVLRMWVALGICINAKQALWVPIPKSCVFLLLCKKLQDTGHSIPRCSRRSCTIQCFFWRCAISLPLPFVLIYFPVEKEDPFHLPPSFLVSAVLFIPLSQLEWKRRWRLFFSTCSRNMCSQNVFFFFSLNHFGNFPGILTLISTKEVHGFYLNTMNSIKFSNTLNCII